MSRIINIISGILFGIGPLAVVIVFGLLIYSSEPNTIVLIIIFIFSLLSIWLGFNIFKKVQIVGPIEFMTSVNASPELDNLELDSSSETKKRLPNELVSLIDNRKNLFKGGTIRIYGDWFGRPYDNYHTIDNAKYDNNEKKLTINFTDRERLEIYNPHHILEVSTFLKIIDADRIKLSWYYFGKKKGIENFYHSDYKKGSKKIQTETNVDYYKKHFDVSMSAPALMIYG